MALNSDHALCLSCKIIFWVSVSGDEHSRQLMRDMEGTTLPSFTLRIKLLLDTSGVVRWDNPGLTLVYCDLFDGNRRCVRCGI